MTDILTKADIVRGKKNLDALDKFMSGGAAETVTLPSGGSCPTRAGAISEIKSELPENSAAFKDVGKEMGEVPVLSSQGLGKTGLGASSAISFDSLGANSLAEAPNLGVFKISSTGMSSMADTIDDSAGVFFNLGYNESYVQQLFFKTSTGSPELMFRCDKIDDGTVTGQGFLNVYHSGNKKPYNTTTATSANVVVTSTGELQRSTSSKFFKRDIKDIDVANYRAALKEVRPISYRSTADTADNPAHSWYSFIAEELAQLDPRLVQFSEVEFYHDVDDEGNQVTLTRTPEDGKPVPSGINTNAVVALQTKIMQLMLADIEALEKEKKAMKSRMTNIEKRLSALEK